MCGCICVRVYMCAHGCVFVIMHWFFAFFFLPYRSTDWLSLSLGFSICQFCARMLLLFVNKPSHQVSRHFLNPLNSRFNWLFAVFFFNSFIFSYFYLILLYLYQRKCVDLIQWDKSSFQINLIWTVAFSFSYCISWIFLWIVEGGAHNEIVIVKRSGRGYPSSNLNESVYISLS